MRLICRARRPAAHPKPVAVHIFHIHLSHSPWIIRGRLPYDRSTLSVLLVQSIHVLHEYGHPHSRLSLRTFAQENLDFAAPDTTECRRIPPIPLFLNTELVDVIIYRRYEVLHIENRDGGFKIVHILLLGIAPAAIRFSAFILSEDRTASQSLRAPGLQSHPLAIPGQRKQIALIWFGKYGRRTPRGDNFYEGVMERAWFLHDCDPDAGRVPRRERCDFHHREFGFAEAFAGAGIGANRVYLQSVSRCRCPRNLVSGYPGLPGSTTANDECVRRGSNVSFGRPDCRCEWDSGTCER